MYMCIHAYRALRTCPKLKFEGLVDDVIRRGQIEKNGGRIKTKGFFFIRPPKKYCFHPHLLSACAYVYALG